MNIIANLSHLGKISIYLVLILFVIFNLRVVSHLKTEREKNELIKNKVKELSVYTQTIEKQLLTSLEYNNSWLNRDIFVRDSNFIEYQLSDLIDSKKLVLVLPDKTCDICNDEAIEEIILFSKQIGLENLIVITSGNRLREFLVFFKKYKLKVNCYGLSDGSFSFDDVDDGLIPYCFISDYDLYVTNFFFLASKNLRIREKYLNSVLNEFGVN